MAPRARTRSYLLVGLLACGLFGGLVAIVEMDRWFFVLLDPGVFDETATPPAPDFSTPAAWAALPETDDGADVAIAALPASDQSQAPIDVFYLHPTTWLGKAWNGPVDDPAVVEATTRGGTLIQASAFNACCAVYAPRYRQANGRAFVQPDANGVLATDVAWSDVSAAFDAFLARTGDRGFVVAAHSQGAVLATRLLRERVAGGPLADRLVAAYVIGAPASLADFGGLPACTSAAQTGCVVAFNARGPGYRPNGLEFRADDPDTMRRRLCVNPLSWDDPTAHAPASANRGALFLDTPTPVLKPAFADAQCRDGALVVTELGDLERDPASRVLLWLMGPENHHPVEYQLFYADLRHNAGERVAAWQAAQAPPSP